MGPSPLQSRKVSLEGTDVWARKQNLRKQIKEKGKKRERLIKFGFSFVMNAMKLKAEVVLISPWKEGSLICILLKVGGGDAAPRSARFGGKDIF